MFIYKLCQKFQQFLRYIIIKMPSLSCHEIFVWNKKIDESVMFAICVFIFEFQLYHGAYNNNNNKTEFKEHISISGNMLVLTQSVFVLRNDEYVLQLLTVKNFPISNKLKSNLASLHVDVVAFKLLALFQWWRYRYHGPNSRRLIIFKSTDYLNLLTTISAK